MRVQAPAKVNLTLEVTGVESNGYHTLDTLFCWLALEDELYLEPATTTALSIEADGVSTALIEDGEENLVLRAHRFVCRKIGRELPTRYRLRKRIPAGGGLGGGSADAAACLVGLNSLYRLNLSHDELLDLARPLGADVAFGLVGGVARGTRYGDMLQEVDWPEELGELSMILVFPGVACPTPEVYKIWDQYPNRVAKGASERFLAATTLDERLATIVNDLEEPALRLHPALREVKEAMNRAGLRGVCLSGSGSTLFGFLSPGGDLEFVRQALEMHDVKIVETRLREARRFELVS